MMSSVWFNVSCDICQQETGLCKHYRGKMASCRIPAPCRGIPTALVLSAVVVRRMIMELLFVFLLSDSVNEPRHEKTNKMSVRPAKTQISLGIRPV